MSCGPACFPRILAEPSACPLPQTHEDQDASAPPLPQLSKRGKAHAAGVTPFWKVFDDVLRNVYAPDTNPNGIINMGIANNSLMEKELLEYFDRVHLDPTDLTYGTSLFGSTRLFRALCHLYNSPTFDPVTPVHKDHILTGPGCGSLLDQLFEHLADPGQSVLIAAPYYNGFDADLMTRSGVKCIPVYSPHGDGSESASFHGDTVMRGFEEALVSAQSKASSSSSPAVSSLILCNPHNPLGRCYDRQALIAYGRFAQRHNLQLVVDEIYSRSTFPTSDEPNPTPFISALNIDWQREAGCHPSRVHIVTSASKDFGLNGFRLGVFISQHNEQLVAAMKATTKLYMVSSPADALWSRLLTDEAFYSWFVAENQRRLTRSYELAKQWCIKHGVSYTPSNAGHFLVADLGRFMPCKSNDTAAVQQAEAALWGKVLQHRVCLTPGSNYWHPTPGMFRLTFAMPEKTLREGLHRLEEALGLSAGQEGGAVVAEGESTQSVLAAAAGVAAAASGSEAAKGQAERELSPGSRGIYLALCGGIVQQQHHAATAPAPAEGQYRVRAC